MKIGYTISLRKIGMVVMVPSSTFQSTTIFVKVVISGPATSVANKCGAKASEVKVKYGV